MEETTEADGEGDGRRESQLADALARERRRLADALHDDALQSIIVARQDVAEAQDGDLELLQSAGDALDAAIASIRGLTTTLREDDLADLPLPDAVGRVVEEAERRGDLAVRVTVDPAAAGLHDVLLVGMARELLTNVVKHAAAGGARLSIRRDADRVLLTVVDDGRGIADGALEAATRAGHLGHTRLREQADALGGELRVDSSDGRGTLVTLALPVAGLEAQRRVAGLVRHERQWSEALLAAMQDGLVVFRDDRVVQVNDRFCELSGWTRAALLAAPAGQPPFWPGASRPGTARAAVEAALRSGDAGGDIEVRLVRADGSRFPVLAAAATVCDDAGRPVGALMTVKDITARAQAEQQRALEQEVAGAHRSARVLGEILTAARAVQTRPELQTLLDRIAQVVSEELGWAVVVNILRPAWGDVAVRATHGFSPEAEQQLAGATYPLSEWEGVLAEQHARRGAYFVPSGPQSKVLLGGGPVVVPDIPVLDHPRAWLPMDLLVVPADGADGTRLGLLCLDLPRHGLRPDDAELDVLVAVGAHIGVALDGVNLAKAARQREHVQEALSALVRRASWCSAAAVVDELARVLGYRRVVLDVLDGARGLLTACAASGVSLDDLGDASATELPRILDAQAMRAGHRLLDREASSRLLPGPRAALGLSVANGKGSLAWQDHLLAVPVVHCPREDARAEPELLGVLWVQDPADRLLPGAGRLRALQAFGGLAGIALAIQPDAFSRP